MKVKDQIEKALDRIRPLLSEDGGGIEFVDFDVETGVLYVRLLGACDGCPLAHITLTESIEVVVTESVPSVKKVVQVNEIFS